MKEDEDLKRYIDEHELVDPLQPREAFYGGRTNAAKLYHECQGQPENQVSVTARRRTPLSYILMLRYFLHIHA